MRVFGAQPVQNDLKHRLSLDQHLPIVEPQHMKPGRVQVCRPPRIGLHRFGLVVLPAIELDDELGFNAGKVGEVATYRMLAPELEAGEAPVAQTLPQGALGVG